MIPSADIVIIIGRFEHLDLMLKLLPLEQPVHVQPCQMHLLGLDLANLDNLFGLDDGAFASLAHERVEVLARPLEDAVSHLVRLGGFDPRKVRVREGLLEQVLLISEAAHLALIVVGGHAAVGIVPPRQLALGVERVNASDAVEGGQTDAGAADFFCKLSDAESVGYAQSAPAAERSPCPVGSARAPSCRTDTPSP